MQPELLGPAHDGSGAAQSDYVPAIERICDDVAMRMQRMAYELRRQKKITAELLAHVGRKGFCRDCKRPVQRVWHIDSSSFVSYDVDGMPHRTTCGLKGRRGQWLTK